MLEDVQQLVAEISHRAFHKLSVNEREIAQSSLFCRKVTQTLFCIETVYIAKFTLKVNVFVTEYEWFTINDF